MSTALLENIQNQPEALAGVVRHFRGAGGESLLRAARILEGKQRIVLSGMGASLFACLAFPYLSSLRQKQISVIESGELLYFLSGQVDSQTAVVLVSRSGASIEVLKLIPKLRERGAAVIGIVNVEASPLQEAADAAIMLGCPNDQMVAVQTYSATVVALTLLAAACAGELNAALDDLEESAGVLARFVPHCLKASETWTAFLRESNPIYLLGRGPTLASVQEGVLLMHETAKAPAIGMSAAQFRHGPVEVVDAQFRAVVIGTQQATLELDAALANDLKSMGGQVRWIGPATNATVESLCEWPKDLPERFAFLGEIVPLQLAAYRKAELNGVRPGDFRWAPLVTTSETGFDTPERSGK